METRFKKLSRCIRIFNFKIGFNIVTLLVLLLSCNGNKAVKTVAPFYASEFCKTDSSNSYEVYIPTHEEGCTGMPLLIILDPHGAGNHAIKRFTESAEKYKCIVAASNKVKNNSDDFIPTIDLLIRDIKTKFPVNDRLYIAGFSGGTRMGLIYAGTHQTNGFIACGALANREQILMIKCPVYSIIGMADFNFAEVAQFILNESTRPSNLALSLAGDMHEWPPSSEITRATGYLLVTNSDNNNNCSIGKEVEKEFFTSQKNRFDSLVESKYFLDAYLNLKNLSMNRAFKNRKLYEKRLEGIKANPLFSAEINNLNRSLQFEFKVRESYYHAFESKDVNWWKKELSELNRQIDLGGEKYMNFSFRRIKAFIGIMCYSISNNCLQANNLMLLEKILEIYSEVEPENADMLFFTAVFQNKKGKKEVALEYLNKSVEKGFSDASMIKTYFPGYGD